MLCSIAIYVLFFVRLNLRYFSDIRNGMSSTENEHFRRFRLFASNKRFNRAKPSHGVCTVYGESAIEERTTRDWYVMFKNEVLTSQTHLILFV
ncbi:hypothetical protein TNCT_646181 [Trichonephila clavata]|uniref:Mos1 transposase HTH domain-containing protein n=1 Tax=Trichonephila clavata TaxID=2740835 RepID=A0A8X6KKU4_TRICU|nr:hypothetical protein TNCT_646181 [Trichonephila clavata]